LFWALTMWAYAGYVRRRTVRRYALMAAMFLLALMSKPMAVTLPAVLLLVDCWPLKRQARWKTLLIEKVPLLVMALASSVVTFVVQRQGGATASLANVPLGFRLANAVLAYGAYLGKSFWPRDLACFYPLTTRVDAWPMVAVVLALLTGLAAWQFRARPYLLIGWLWFLGTLVPVIGIVQVGDQAYADRYTYLPLVGLFIAVVWLAAEVFELIPAPAARNGMMVVVAAVLVALSVRSWIQVGYWRDTDSLARRALALSPENPRGHLLLAVDRYEKKQIDESIEHCLMAIRYLPDDPVAHNQLALGYAHRREDQLAAEAWERSLALLAEDADPARLQHDARWREAVYNLGLLRFRKHKLDDAAALLNKRLAATPDDPATLVALAGICNEKGDAAGAADYAEHALRVSPSYTEAWYVLGLARLSQGRADDSDAAFSKVLATDPLDPDANAQRGELRRRQGRLAEAAEHFRKALSRRADDASVHFKLGTVLQATGSHAEAADHFRRAIELNPESAARNNLAWLRATANDATLRNGAEAVRLAEALRESGEAARPELLDTLAAAYAEAGDFTRATETARAAADAADKASNPKLAAQIRQRLTLYEKKQPYRE
jgi:tetratricopeptide (TPR) repeat protein